MTSKHLSVDVLLPFTIRLGVLRKHRQGVFARAACAEPAPNLQIRVDGFQQELLAFISDLPKAARFPYVFLCALNRER